MDLSDPTNRAASVLALNKQNKNNRKYIFAFIVIFMPSKEK
jgi:hypothetical protein